MIEQKKKTITLVSSAPNMEYGRLLNEFRMFREAGYEVSYYGWDRLREYPKEEARFGCTIRRCQLKGSYSSKSLLIYMPLWWLVEFFHLMRHRPDYIYAIDFDTVMPALLVKWLRGTPVVFSVLDFFSAKSRAMPRALKPAITKAEQYCARWADGVVIVDEARKYLLGKKLPKRLVVAQNCAYDTVDPDWKKQEREELTLFYAGVIGPQRGLRKLVRATEGLERVRVLIAGRIKDGSYPDVFEKARHVTFMGTLEHEEVIRLTFESDAVYSYYDPAQEINRTANSIKMFEAFMCSTAVLNNSEPPTAKIVEKYQCGSCLPYADEEGLRNVIVRWRDNRELCRQAGRNGRKAFEEEYNWETASKPILDLFSKEA